MSPGVKAPHAEIVKRLRRHLAELEEQGYVVVNDFPCLLRQHSMLIPDLAVVGGQRWDKAVREEIGRPRVLTFVALGGEGKTSLVAKWTVDEMLAKGWPGCAATFAWSSDCAAATRRRLLRAARQGRKLRRPHPSVTSTAWVAPSSFSDSGTGVGKLVPSRRIDATPLLTPAGLPTLTT